MQWRLPRAIGLLGKSIDRRADPRELVVADEDAE